ncbi:MAG: DoxX family protein [Bacteroidia bacterium]|nr:DoxX family protein [Bacteroidia bacterium]
MEEYNFIAADLFLRCVAGLLFFFQGYDKLFRLGLKEVVKTFHYDAESHHVPDFFVWMIAIYSSFVEFFCGLLLILGLFKTWALVLLGLDIILVVFAFSFMKPMWDMKHVFPRFILLIALLVIPAQWGKFSLDQLIFK